MTQRVERTLDDTFKDAKIEFEDLDGLAWPKTAKQPQDDPGSPPLEPLFGPEKPSIPTIIYETGWISPISSPDSRQHDLDRPTCQSHPRTLSRSRSRRTSEVSSTRVEASDPFAFVPVPCGREQELEWQKKAQVGVSITRPPSVKHVENQSRPFGLVELPPVEDLTSSIGPPPGLPPPRPGFRPPQGGIPFPTRV